MSQSVLENERIISLDVIRGFAILGIFLVNIPLMIGIEHPLETRAYEGVDALVRLIYDLFIQTKFYTIFAFLFGMGFYLFVSRAEEKGKTINPLFIRRLIILLIVGVSHAILLWSGDILNLYAIQGFWLLLFYQQKPKTLLIWSLSLIACFGAFIYMSYPPTMSATRAVVPVDLTYNALDEYTEGISSRTIFFIKYGMTNWIAYIPEVLGLFLLGLYCGKINLFNRVKELSNRIKLVSVVSLLLTLIISIPILMYFSSNLLYDSKKIYFFIYLGGKTLAVWYVTSLMLLLQNARWRVILRPLSYVGRMALTNYLLQTIVTMLVLPLLIPNSAVYPLWASMFYCILFFLLQMGLSKWWLRRFSFGPIEWLWRIGTYGKMQPFKQNRRSLDDTTLPS